MSNKIFYYGVEKAALHDLKNFSDTYINQGKVLYLKKTADLRYWIDDGFAPGFSDEIHAIAIDGRIFTVTK